MTTVFGEELAQRRKIAFQLFNGASQPKPI